MSAPGPAVIVLAGGSGERFWPVSSRERPKQFLDLAGEGRSLLRAAWERAQALAGPGRAFLSTLPHLREASLAECPGLSPERCLVEPDRRDTAGALLWAMACLAAQGADAEGVAILTSDQRIGPDEAFFEDVRRALELAEEIEGLAVIGIRPTRAETGFGYIELGEPAGPGRRVLRFREKPNQETAEEFAASGRFLWNAGMFFWTAAAFRRELAQAQPEMAEAFDRMASALAGGREEEAVEAFRSLPKLSIDYALMERAERVGVVEARFQWDDLGTWEALSRSLAADGRGNVSLGSAMGLEAERCIIHAPGYEVSLLGVEGLVVVVHEGRVLVMPRERAQDLKKLAADGQPIGAAQASGG